MSSIAAPLDTISLSSFSASGGLSLALLLTAATVSERVFYITSNGVAKVLERAPLSATLPTSLTINAVLFELAPAALEYKQFTYVRTERVIYVQGKDDSASQATLAFDSSSNVRVLVNGVLLDPSLYDKSIEGTISFVPQLEAPSLLIEVFVYKSLAQFFDESQALRLPFTALDPFAASRTVCAWGDVASVGPYIPLFCPGISTLDRSKTYGLVRFEAVDETNATVTVDPLGFFLLAQPPYAFEDKRLTANVELSSLIAEGFPLSFAVNGETGETDAVIDGETLNPLLRALTYVKLDNPLSAQSSSTVSLIVSRNEKTYIIGPA